MEVMCGSEEQVKDIYDIYIYGELNYYGSDQSNKTTGERGFIPALFEEKEKLSAINKPFRVTMERSFILIYNNDPEIVWYPTNVELLPG